MEHRRQQGLWVLVGVAAVVVLLLVLVPLFFMAMMGPGMMGGMGGMVGQPGPMMGPGLLMVFFWLLIVVGVALLLIWAARRLRGPGAGAGEETALAILQRRYARGEISREEYEQMRADLLRDRSER